MLDTFDVLLVIKDSFAGNWGSAGLGSIGPLTRFGGKLKIVTETGTVVTDAVATEVSLLSQIRAVKTAASAASKVQKAVARNEQIKQIRVALNALKHDETAYRSLQQRIGEWYDAGIIAKAKGGDIDSYDGLEKIANLGKKPDTMARPWRHHDFPIGDQLDREFVVRGLDPNEFGRWIPYDVHRKFHSGDGYAKEFNQFVIDYFEEARTAETLVTDDQLLQLLNDVRTAYPYP